MAMLALDINDAGITVLDGKSVVYREPGFALLEEGGLTTGNEAYANARVKPRRIHSHFWSELSTEALPDDRFRHLTSADLVSRQLEQIWAVARSHGDRLVVAAPHYMQAQHLGLFLGICNELSIPVAALVDAAVAATRRQYLNATPLHVDLSLHATLMTRLGQGGQAQVEKSAVVEGAGLSALYDTWIRTIAEAFVQQSRFDPLHTADTEQLLLDRLPGWLSVASGGTSVTASIEYRGIEHTAEIDALALVAAVAPLYQNILSQLRTLCRADETPAIQLTDRAAGLPGLADMLKARVGGQVFMLEPGAAARGALARCRDGGGSGSGVSLVRQLPWDQSPIEVAVDEQASRGGRPTHVLFGNTAYAISEEPLSLGSQVAAGERQIDFPDTMPGMSRKHCTLSIENGQCVVHDLSRYGTFLNGHRLDGSAVLQVGDLLRIGTPGFELRLITTEAEHGA